MAKTARRKTARKANAAFMKPATPSALGEVIGEKSIPRTEVTKKLWAYIKKNGLQERRGRKTYVNPSGHKTKEIDPALSALAHLYSKL